MSIGDDGMNIRIDADGTAAVIGLGEVTVAAGNTKDALDDINKVNYARAEAKIQALAANTARMDANYAAFVKRTTHAAASVERVGKSIDGTNKHGTKAHGVLDRLNKHLHETHKASGKAHHSMRLLHGMIFKLALAGLISAAVKLLAGAIIALASAATMAIAGLSPLIGLLGAIPGLLIAFLSVKGVFKLAFSGIGDAVKVLSDTKSSSKEIEAVLNGMTPAARSFALALHDWKPQLEMLRGVAAQGMLPGFEKALDNLGPLIPIVRTAVDGLARTIGGLAEEGSAMLASGPFRKDFATIAERNNTVVKTLGHALFSLVDVFRNVAIAAGPLLQHIADLVLQFAKYLQKTTQAGRDSGKLEAFFNRVGKLLDKLIPVVRDFGVGLFNVFKASIPAAGVLGQKTADVAKHFRAVTGSAEGQNKLRKYFNDTLPGIFELFRLVRDIGKWLIKLGGGNSLAPFIEELRVGLLPSLAKLLDALGGSGHGSGTLIGVLASVADIITEIAKSGAFGSFLLSVQAFAAILLTIVRMLDHLPTPLYKAIALIAAMASIWKGINWAFRITGLQGLVAGLLEVRNGFIGAELAAGAHRTGLMKLGGLLKHPIQYMKDFAFAIKYHTVLLWDNIKKIGLWIGRAIIWIAKMIIKIALWVAERAIMILTAITAAALTLVEIGLALALGDVATAQAILNAEMLANPYGLIAVLVIALGAALYWAYKKFEPFHHAIDNVGRALMGAWDHLTAFMRVLGELLGLSGSEVQIRVMLDIVKGLVGFNDGEGLLKREEGAKKRGFSRGWEIVKNFYNAGPLQRYERGGPVSAGTTALVGEVGPEAFVSASGKSQIIGAGGPEVRAFSQRGFVVPYDILARATAATNARLPAYVLAALSGIGSASAGADIAASPQAPAVSQQGGGGGAAMGRGSNDLTFNGPLIGEVTIQDATELAEIERMILTTVRRMRREEKERSSR